MVQEGLHLAIQNDLAEIAHVTQAIQLFSGESKLPHDVNYAFQLIAEEMLSNIILHGYPENGLHTIKIDIEAKSGEICLQIRDDGVPFNLLEHSVQKKPSSLDEIKVGGLGVLLIRSNVDEISYKYEDGWNVVALTKRLS